MSQNQYDFILNSSNQPKKSGLGRFLPSPANKTQRLIFISIAGVVLMLLMLVAYALVSSSGSSNREQLLGLAKRHAEIIRVADIGAEKAKGAQARNLAVTTKLSLQSSQSGLMEIVNKTGKVSNKELSAGQNKETDTALEAAERSNRFDEAFIEELTKQLTDYRAELQAAFRDSSSSGNKQVYSSIFNQIAALVPEKS